MRGILIPKVGSTSKYSCYTEILGDEKSKSPMESAQSVV